MGGELAVYFEPAAVIVTLVLLGQVLELRARSQTNSAIKARARSRATPWFRRLKRFEWFDEPFIRILYRRVESNES